MKEKRRIDLCSAAILTLQVLLLMFLTWRFGAQHLDGDDSAEMILARLLAEEGGLLSRNWFYSTELRVLNNQIVMSLLFRVFRSWRVVRTVGTGLLLGVLLLSYRFLCGRIPEGERLKKWAPVILLPFSWVYLDFVLYGLYYIPHISIVFLSLGLLLSPPGKRAAIDLGLLLLLAFAAGLGGIRLPAVGYAPIFLATLYLFLTKQDSAALKRSLAACSAAAAGYLVNALVLSRRYSYMTHSDLKLTAPNLQMAKKVLTGTLQVFGGGIPALSVEGLGAVAGLLLSLCILHLLTVIMKKWGSVSAPLQIVLLSFTFSWLITAFTAVFTNNGWTSRYALIPCMGFIPLLAEGTALLKGRRRTVTAACAAALLLLSGAAQMSRFVTEDKLRDVRPAYDYILKSGMSFGYSNWEVGDVMTELSDGRVHVCKVQNYANLWRWNWLMARDYTKYAASGPVFLLLDKARFTYTNNRTGYFYGNWTESDMTWRSKAAVGFEDDSYIVWVFSSEAEFEEITGSRPHE